MRPLLIAAAFALLAAPVGAQVEVTSLAAPDYFSLGDRETGLPVDLWRGTSPAMTRDVIPQIGRKPLSPAFAGLAVRLLAAGVNGPEDVGRDPDVAAARIQALLALGDPRSAWAAAERAPAAAGNLNLAQAVAETALIAGQEGVACRLSEQLTVGRGEPYWLRLRAYCQAAAGQTDAAQLTFTLANDKARDPVYARLMGAVLVGVGDPGAASLRNGLDYALSRRLALDLEAARATASPGVSGQIWPPTMRPMPENYSAARSMIATATTTPRLFDMLLDEADAAAPRARPGLVGHILLLEAMGGQPGPDARGRLARADAGKSLTTPALLLALDRAAALGLKGETALIAVAIAADAGPQGPAAVDRARILKALRQVGLTQDLEGLAIEGLLVQPAK